MENTIQPGRQPKYVHLSNQLTNTRCLSKEWGAPNTIDHLQKMQDNIKNMIDKIHHWEDKYLISSPIEGKVTFLKPIKENYPITADEDIFGVNPRKESSRIVIGQIRASSYTKVKVGQELRISLDAFPSTEYGFLKGTIIQVSDMAVNNNYPITIALSDNLNTTSNHVIPMQQNLHGTGEIVIKDQSMLNKISSSLKLDAISTH